MKSGVMGGTFDPPHVGHILPVQEAVQEFGLDRVWFVPNSIPPHKSRPRLTNPFHRTVMVALAIRNEPRFLLDTRELGRETVSYTFDTMVELQQEYPEDRFFFILGSDSFLEIDTWYRYRELIGLCEFIIINRGSSEQELNDNLERLERLLQRDLRRSFHFSRSPHIPVSSTQVRSLLEQGGQVSDLIPNDVEEYICKQQLYVRR